MDKTKAALLAMGIAIGAGSTAGVGALISPAAAKPAAVMAHAVDLRREHDGSRLRATVYGTQLALDGGYKDVGQGRCRPLSDAAQKQLITCMNTAGETCDW